MDRLHSKADRNRLTLLRPDDAGYRNLVELPRTACSRVYRGASSPVDLDQVQHHSEGMITLTRCLASRFCRACWRIVSTTPARTPTSCGDLRLRNVYFEVQENGLADQDKCNKGIVRIARESAAASSAPATCTTCAARTTTTTRALLCVQTKSTLAAPKMIFETNEF